MVLTLTRLERAVLDMLLAGDHQTLVALRSQLAIAEIRERDLTGHGFYTDFAFPATKDVQPVTPRKLVLGDVWASTGTGLPDGAGFLLFVDEGVLNFLEGFTYGGETWRPSEADDFVLEYRDEPNPAFPHFAPRSS